MFNSVENIDRWYFLIMLLIPTVKNVIHISKAADITKVAEPMMFFYKGAADFKLSAKAHCLL